MDTYSKYQFPLNISYSNDDDRLFKNLTNELGSVRRAGSASARHGTTTQDLSRAVHYTEQDQRIFRQLESGSTGMEGGIDMTERSQNDFISSTNTEYMKIMKFDGNDPGDSIGGRRDELDIKIRFYD